MKINRNYLFIGASSVALLIVLIIQVNWIFETAKMKEQLFNEKASLVLSKTAEALSSDKQTRNNLEIFAGKNEVHTIDSLFNYYMKSYNFHIDYYFELRPVPVIAKAEIPWTNFEIKDTAPVISNENVPGNNTSGEQQGCYSTCLPDEPGKSRMELKLVIPGKEQFIIAEMGTPFITSVILILVVLVMSWRTIMSLLKEKKISEHTTDFLNNMTHEFKTPLTNIALAGKMIVRDSNINHEEKIKHYSGIILEENEKLKHQVEQVLSMTALERGEIPIRKTELDFHQVVIDSLKCISIQIENTKGNVKLNLDADRFVVMGDKIHLTNALCNLLENAVKYSKENPELFIHTNNINHKLVFVISDNGIGIEKEYQKKIFDKFFRVPTGDIHDVKGFGIGLAYVKAIVELHGGTIDLRSEKGEGSSFTITLPNV